jgi:hypothetical protein
MKKILLTFGCSWTKGIGTGYEEGMTLSQFKQVAFDHTFGEEHSFRILLSKKYELENIDFSQGGSSNQLQFMRVKQFFTSDEFKNLVNENAKIIVLHGITSTARTCLFDNETQTMRSIAFNDITKNEPFIKNYVMNFYNHDYEVARLTEEMQFINQWYKAMDIKNLWFDTFNSHAYTSSIDNLIGQESNVDKQDMMSRMATLAGITDMDNDYHLSGWQIDTNRAEFLVKHKYLNPYSIHPTKLGHQLLADIIGNDLEKII